MAGENSGIFTQLGFDPVGEYYPFPCFPGA